MRFYLLVFFSAAILSCTKKENQKTSAVIDFARHYTINANYDKEHSALLVKVVLDKSIHAYADGEKIGRPVKLVAHNQNGWQTLGVPNVPKGTHVKLPGLGESIILENTFVIEQKMVPGAGVGKASLYLQVCSDNTCDQPRQHELVFSAD